MTPVTQKFFIRIVAATLVIKDLFVGVQAVRLVTQSVGTGRCALNFMRESELRAFTNEELVSAGNLLDSSILEYFLDEEKRKMTKNSM